jgi:phospholipid/cholesterol/gamma-HCH transport system substrate-binding protein
MSQKHGIIEFILGFCVIGLVLASLCMVYEKQFKNFNKIIVLKAEFDSIDGLMEGALVKVNGVTVGNVKSMELNSDFMAIVSFSVRADIKLPQDTTASIISESLFGGKVLSLSPGVEKDAFLSEGEVIDKTQSPMNLEDLINKFIFGGGDAEGKGKKNEDPSSDNSAFEGFTEVGA